MKSTARNRGEGITLRVFVLCLALFLLTAALFSPSLGNRFVFDDHEYVESNSALAHGLTLEAVRWSATAFSSGNWQPLTWLTHALDVTLFGMDPGPHHLANILLHAASAILLFLVLVRLTGASGRAWSAAILFAVHPLRVESVAWVAERKDVLSGFFWLLCLIFYVRYCQRPGWRRYLPVLGVFVLGLLSKPTVVTLPVVLLLVDWWPLGRLGQAGMTRADQRRRAIVLVREKLPLVAAALCSVVVTFLAQQRGGALKSFGDYPLWVRVENALVSYGAYLAKVAWPAELAVFYPHPGAAIPLGSILLSSTLLVGITVTAAALRRRHPYLLMGWLWYLVTLLPVIGLVQVGSHAMADRFTYLPSLGLLVVVAWGIPLLLASRPALASAVFLAAVSLSAITIRQIPFWRDDKTLFSHAIDVTPDNWFAHYNLAAALAVSGQQKDAVIHYQEALRIRPGFLQAENNLRFLQAGMASNPDLELYYDALRLNPNNDGAHNNLGIALARQSRFREAEEHLRRAVAIAPANAEAHNNLGLVLARQARHREAVVEYQEALRLRPGDPLSSRNLEKSLKSLKGPWQ